LFPAAFAAGRDLTEWGFCGFELANSSASATKKFRWGAESMAGSSLRWLLISPLAGYALPSSPQQRRILILIVAGFPS
jgi:hypothetical protein